MSASAYQDHNGMTLKQKMFCVHYLSNGYKKIPAIREAYGGDKSDAVCSVMAHENLRKPNISKYIEKRMNEAIEKAGVGLEWRLNNLKRMTESCAALMDEFDTRTPTVEPECALKAIAEINKMDGAYAPTQTESKVSVQEVNLDNVDESITKFEQPV